MPQKTLYRCTLCGEVLQLDEKDSDKALAHLLSNHIDLLIAFAWGVLEYVEEKE